MNCCEVNRRDGERGPTSIIILQHHPPHKASRHVLFKVDAKSALLRGCPTCTDFIKGAIIFARQRTDRVAISPQYDSRYSNCRCNDIHDDTHRDHVNVVMWNVVMQIYRDKKWNSDYWRDVAKRYNRFFLASLIMIIILFTSIFTMNWYEKYYSEIIGSFVQLNSCFISWLRNMIFPDETFPRNRLAATLI